MHITLMKPVETGNDDRLSFYQIACMENTVAMQSGILSEAGEEGLEQQSWEFESPQQAVREFADRVVSLLDQGYEEVHPEYDEDEDDEEEES